MSKDQVSVIVIGAGFGGLTMAKRLLDAGIEDVLVLEKQDGVGGVWRANTYPGAACDVPSSLYSWSYALNPSWHRQYAEQPEILAYIERTARELQLTERVRTGVEVASATWSDQDTRWEVTTTAGEVLHAEVVVSCQGQLSRPAWPTIPGRDSFTGPMFHSATWDHGVDLRGKRVAVIGTGASAIQFVPAIAAEAASITVFQRSAPYVIPKPDWAQSERRHAFFKRFPAAQRLERRSIFATSELLNKALTEGSWLTPVLYRAWRTYLWSTIRDPELRRKLRPDYELGCKRLLFSNQWYPCLAQSHVTVTTSAIKQIEADGVRTSDGELVPADVIIAGTGFAATEFLAPVQVTGSGGKALAEIWKDGAHAYFGITVPELPNFFMLYGPNTNLGGSSIIGMLEAQADHVIQVVSRLRRGQRVEVSAEAEAAFDREVQERLSGSAWAGCASWYREPSGRISTNWPGLVTEYVDRATSVRFEDYEVSA